jgi:dTDP-4-dehydrorhamnose reductase
MSILVIGSNGQLGRQVQRVLADKKTSFFAFDYPEVDITSVDSIRKLFEQTKPTAIINCAAYTNVDQAETDYDNAYQINALGPKNLAEICVQNDAELVHVSTDYVFSGDPICLDGKPRPYLEDDVCRPSTAYGKTKLEGEHFVRQSGAKSYILRTAWLYGEGNNFVRTMLKLAETHHSIKVVKDQIGSPTSTVDLANAICELLGTGAYGLYHATCEGQCSWFDFAGKIFELSGKKVEVVPVTSEEFVRPAKRPAWSVLENAQLKSIGMNVFRPWEESLKEYLSIEQ